MAEKTDETIKSVRPISALDRLVIQNIFDNQPARRVSYLKKLGYEMDKEDDNLIRPLDSPTAEWSKIDPGFTESFSKGGIAGLLQEAGQDAGDIIIDMAKGTTAFGAGPLGAVLASTAGEGFKVAAQEALLDESVGLDKTAIVLDALTSGIAAKVFKPGITLAKSAQKKIVQETQEAIVKSVNLGFDRNAVREIAKDPGLMKKAALEGAEDAIANFRTKLLGGDDVIPDKEYIGLFTDDSLFSKAINPKIMAKNAELEKLAANPAADMKTKDIMAFFEKEYFDLAAKKYKSASDEGSMAALESSIKKIKQGYTEILPDGTKKLQETLNAKEQRQLLSGLHDDVYTSKIGALKDPTAKLKMVLDQKATNLGSKLPEINQLISRTIQTKKVLETQLDKNKVFNAFQGRNVDAKRELAKGLEEAATLLELPKESITKELQTLQLQYKLNKVVNGGMTPGSGNVITNAIKGAVQGGYQGAALGTALAAPVGIPQIGAVGGGIVGAARGAMKGAEVANPVSALKQVADLGTKEQALESQLTKLATGQYDTALRPMAGAAATAATAVERDARESMSTPEDLDLSTLDLGGSSESPSQGDLDLDKLEF